MPKTKQAKMWRLMEEMRKEYPHFQIQVNWNKENEEPETTFTASDIFAELDKYASYSFFYTPYSVNYLSEATYFMKCLEGFVFENMENLERIMRAYKTDYDPLENYALREQGSDGTKRSGETMTSSGTDSVKDSGDDSVKRTGSDTLSATGKTVDVSKSAERITKNYKNGFDSAEDGDGVRSDTVRDHYWDGDGTEQNQGLTFSSGTSGIGINEVGLRELYEHGRDVQDKTEYNSTTTTTHGKNQTTTYGKTDTKTVTNALAMDAAGGNPDTTAKYNETQTHYFTRNGNIGVTTSQQMLQSELDLRTYRVLETFIKAFADEYLVLIFDPKDIEYEDEDEGWWF